MREGVLETIEMDEADEFRRFLLALCPGQALRAQCELEVLLHGHPGEKRGLLVNQQPLGIGACNGMSVDRDVAAAGRDVSSQGVQQCGFTAPGRSKQTHEFSRVDIQIDVLQRLDVVAVAVSELRDGNLRHAPWPPLPWHEETFGMESIRDFLQEARHERPSY